MRDLPRVIDKRLVDRIRADFCEMPGLRLTPRQAQRLWHCDETTCRTVLDRLVESRFLTRAAAEEPWLLTSDCCYHLNVSARAAA